MNLNSLRVATFVVTHLGSYGNVRAETVLSAPGLLAGGKSDHSAILRCWLIQTRWRQTLTCWRTALGGVAMELVGWRKTYLQWRELLSSSPGASTPAVLGVQRTPNINSPQYVYINEWFNCAGELFTSMSFRNASIQLRRTCSLSLKQLLN
jgi:hypothetical protein